MATRGIQLGVFAVIGVAGFVLLGWATPHAQGLGQASSGQMTELISEVKLMRVALQELAHSQSQWQALATQLNAQQARITQASARLDAANAQLADVASRAKDAARELAIAQTLFARTPDPNQHAALGQQITGLKQLGGELASEQAQLRSRVSQLTSTLGIEEQRWQTLSSRLDALARK